MKTDLVSFFEFNNAICENELVFLFGTGISSALTGERYGWYKWIADGIGMLADADEALRLKGELDSDSSADNLISVAGGLIRAAKSDGSYSRWMHRSFELGEIRDSKLARTLQKLTLINDIFTTTNYDLLLERATGLKSLSYEQPDMAFEMIRSGQSDSVLHIHGIYDSVRGIDSIIADKEQYESVLDNKGAQFIQNFLGTRMLIFIGCGKTTEDLNIRQFVEFARKYLKLERPYYFLYNTSSPVEGLPDNIHLIPYGDEYSDLPGFLEDMANKRIQHRIEGSRVIGRTAFNSVFNSKDPIQRYHFSQSDIPFCGRIDELGRLAEFVESESSFSWWAITGQGGAGKSRLAYELIHQLPLLWFGFFLADDVLPSDAESFVPFCNTVVILDYVAGRERLAAGLMSGFKRSFAKTSYKCRILLLERSNEKGNGSWYSILFHKFGSVDEGFFKAFEYSEDFLNLKDMDRVSVERFIGSVCAAAGLEADPLRDSELYESYGRKFERLQFRPLYLQLFVEAWIANGCDVPKYDNYTGLLEDLLIREQAKWMDSFDCNQDVCNACVRLMVRANIAPIKVGEVPDLYKEDWNCLQNYIVSHSFTGRQKGELQDSLINSMCQNIERSHEIIAPQFPDIIKEYMFCYYTDAESLPDIMREIWLNAAGPFSVFITKCLMDFEDQEFFKQALNAYKVSTADTDVLEGRLGLLQNRLIQRGEDPRVFLELIENEYGFWSSVLVPEEDEKEREYIAGLKVAGLAKVAEHIWAWSMYDVSLMMDVIDEMLKVPGGSDTNIMKEILLRRFVQSLSEASFVKEAEYLRDKLDRMIGLSPEGELEIIFQMQNYNVKMMNCIITGDFRSAKGVLLEMEKKCNKEELLSVQMLAGSCFNFDASLLQMGHPGTIGTGLSIVKDLEMLYPDDEVVRLRRIGCRAVELRKLNIKGKSIESELDELDSELAGLSISKDDDFNEAFSMTWGLVKSLQYNYASREDVEKILKEAEAILEINPKLTEVASTLIMGIRALYTDFYHRKVTRREVERLYKYVKINPDSESIRNAFFEMLQDSEEAGRDADYLNQDIIREAFQDARYNPMMGSGIPAIDFQEFLLEEALTTQTPYVRKQKKIGRNDPCPCGSGKKFKNCCMRKGEFLG